LGRTETQTNPLFMQASAAAASAAGAGAGDAGVGGQRAPPSRSVWAHYQSEFVALSERLEKARALAETEAAASSRKGGAAASPSRSGGGGGGGLKSAALLALAFALSFLAVPAAASGVRYVRLTSALNDYFNVGEVYVTDVNGVNQALGKPVTMSTMYNAGVGETGLCTPSASNPTGVVDFGWAITDGNLCTFASTTTGLNQWMEIDLGVTLYTITSVTVYPRSDNAGVASAYRANGAVISLKDASRAEVYSFALPNPWYLAGATFSIQQTPWVESVGCLAGQTWSAALGSCQTCPTGSFNPSVLSNAPCSPCATGSYGSATSPAPKVLSLFRPSLSSSTYGTNTANYANDGILSVGTGQQFVNTACTAADSIPWWQVDLGNVYTLSYLNFYDRPGAGTRENGLQVYVGNSPSSTSGTASTFGPGPLNAGALPASYAGPSGTMTACPSGPFAGFTAITLPQAQAQMTLGVSQGITVPQANSLQIPCALSGRYVVVAIPTNCLNFNELQVVGVPPAQAVCAACPAGTTTSAPGATSAGACAPCAAGSFAPSVGSPSCSLCPGGTYSAAVGANSSATCLSCPAGANCPGGTASFSAGSCPAGSCEWKLGISPRPRRNTITLRSPQR